MPNSLLKNRYLMGSLIGSGGMANVYKGHDIRSGHTVAIKILKQEFNQNQEFIRRFEREAELAAAVSHDNIVKLLDVGYEDNQHFLILEYIDGYTLKEYIRQHGALPYDLWLKIAREMASALASAHQANIIHRDIKSQNILLTRHGLDAKITDFGIAREVYTSTITASDSGILGSVHYFSPEHARGDVVDAQSDIYSFGVVLYEMATGHVPFDGETPVSIALKHLQDTPVAPDAVNPQVTGDMKRIIMRCLEKDRKLRYVNTKQLCYDLDLLPAEPFYEEKEEKEEKEEQREEEKTSVTSNPPKKRTKRRKDKVWTALAILLTVLAVGGIFIFVMELTGHPILSRYLQGNPTYAKVPAVGGMTEENGIALLEKNGFTVHVVRDVKDNVAMGLIYDQIPASGEHPAEKEVTIYVSSGSSQSIMPDLKSKDEN
ncbi:MAG: protein kinase, partial [Clostridia bacterium]|nr:protein kinase [Clostridia bacterium]